MHFVLRGMLCSLVVVAQFAVNALTLQHLQDHTRTKHASVKLDAKQARGNLGIHRDALVRGIAICVAQSTIALAPRPALAARGA